MQLYGKNPVIERLKTNPKTIKRILVEEGHVDASYIKSKASKWGIGFQVIPKTKMQKITRTINSQGILAKVEDFRYTDYDELLARTERENLSLVFLDGLTDPQNLGAIIRSLACLGGFAVVLPRKDSVDVTESALRVASGGDNFVAVAKVSNLTQAISEAKKRGVTIAGAVTGEGENLMQAVFSFPVGLVIGSEQKGIRDIIKNQLQLKITIPMSQPRLSFNAAQATTILCYEINKQKTTVKK